MEQNDVETEKRINAEATQIIRDLLLSRGLYESVEIESEVGAKVALLLQNDLTTGFDAYCTTCRRETIFRISPKTITAGGTGGRYINNVTVPKLRAIHATCQRNWQVYTYVFIFLDKTVTKIGQSPSLADIAFGELRLFDKSLEDQDRVELGKALGLFAHRTALGAFAYMRRVFERMIARAHDRQIAAGGPIAGFPTMRMDEKIAALKSELPERVVRNSAIFSVLSLGLHELTEEQCAAHFPVMKAVLFQMLEQEEHRRKAAITEAQTDAALSLILSNPKCD